jgi:SNF2 family DNA or RNA helicase
METAVITKDFIEGKKARAIPGATFDPESRAWVFAPERNVEATRMALHLFPELRNTLKPEWVQAADFGAADDDVRPFDAATPWAAGRPAAELLPMLPDDILEKLYPYQAVDVGYAVARMRVDGGAYLGWDRGLGKTLGAIAVALAIPSLRTVIVTPNSSKETVWRPEIEKWAGDRLGQVLNLGGTKPKRDKAIASWAMDGGVLLVHYEALRLVEWKKLPKCDLVICDEAHRLAKGQAGSKAPQFFKSLRSIKSDYRLALSGSIIVNGPEDFFGANHWLFPDNYKSKWRDWNDKYIRYIEGHFGRTAVGIIPDKLEPLKHELAQFMVVRRKEDELPGLPDRLTQTIRVDLSVAQRRVYDDLAEQFFAELDNGEVLLAPNVVTQLVRLRQVACGLDLLGDEFTDSAKLDVAEQLVVDNLPRKTVVFCWHRATVRALTARLESKGVQTVAIDGDVPMAERARRVSAFQDSEDGPKAIVATIKTLGESVTLHRASDLVFVESSWTPADMEQAADRVYRIGQKHRVTITHLVARNTIDETRILPRVADKAAMRRLVLGGS